MMSAEPGTVPLERERRLVLAILEEAVRSYQHYAFATNRRGRRLFGETCEWFDSHDNTWIFSFENICTVLDLEPQYIRRGLHDWKRRARAAAGVGQVVRLETPGAERDLKCANGGRH
jgi:hypothetical protein